MTSKCIYNSIHSSIIVCFSDTLFDEDKDNNIANVEIKDGENGKNEEEESGDGEDFVNVDNPIVGLKPPPPTQTVEEEFSESLKVSLEVSYDPYKCNKRCQMNRVVHQRLKNPSRSSTQSKLLAEDGLVHKSQQTLFITYMYTF